MRNGDPLPANERAENRFDSGSGHVSPRWGTERIAMKDVMEYFDMTVAEFRREWAKMTPSDKEHLKTGIQSGTLTY